MSRKPLFSLLHAAAAVSLVAVSGCSWPLNTTFSGPSVHIPVPVPVSPYFQKGQEDKFWVHERYERVPVIGPLTAGGPPAALDPPSADEVMRALEKARPTEGGVPLLHEVQRSNVRMIVEPLGDYVDPVRVIPLIGPAQLHHANYKCTIYYAETTRVGWPVPYTTVDEDATEVVYIDHAHFHRVGDVHDGSVPTE